MRNKNLNNLFPVSLTLIPANWSNQHLVKLIIFCSYLFFKTYKIIGICVKLIKTDDKSKVFINLCHHADIPAPEDITTEELVEVLSSKDPERYCVPLSIGTEHEELDKCKI